MIEFLKVGVLPILILGGSVAALMGMPYGLAYVQEYLEKRREQKQAQERSKNFAQLTFPIVRRVFPGLIANEIVSVQPMTAPVGGTFYLDHLYGAHGEGSETVAASPIPEPPPPQLVELPPPSKPHWYRSMDLE
jgi:hypothetical protein